jgi:hypothetical protein
MLFNVEQMKKIKKGIRHSFFCHSRPASNFADNSLKEVCLKIFSDYHQTYCVLMMNDAGVPPVKAVLMLYRDFYYLKPDKIFSMQDSQNIGSLMTFVFKEVLGYEVKKDRARVGLFGIATGRVFVKDDPADLSILVQDAVDNSQTCETLEWGNGYK